MQIATSANGPNAPSSLHLPKTEALPDVAMRIRRPLVLVVEDEPAVLVAIVQALGLLGGTVLTATTCGEAVQLVRALCPDMILLDLLLPDAHGTQAMERLAQESCNTPIVVLSANLAPETRDAVMQLGAFQALDKPLRVARLLGAVHDALHRGSPGRQSSPKRAPLRVQTRLVELMLCALRANGDLPTLAEWARHAGVGLTTLRAACYRSKIRPHNAHGFVRVLAAIIRAKQLGCDVDLALEIADDRTVKALFARGGVTAIAGSMSVDAYFDAQHYLPGNHPALAVLRATLRPFDSLD